MTDIAGAAIIFAMIKAARKRRTRKEAAAQCLAAPKRGRMAPFTPAQIGTLATFLEQSQKLHAKRDLALMRTALDTMLRSVDLLDLTFEDVLRDGEVVNELQVIQKKTGTPVTCILTESSRGALRSYLEIYPEHIRTDSDRLLFPIATRRYQYIVDDWCGMLRLDKSKYSTHSFRRTKAAQIYKTTRNVAAIKQLLGHKSLAYTEAYLGVEKSDALDLARETIL